MPSARSYGDVLRRARESAGIDAVTMARRLHVRPDIIKAIETADFERMPARGYSRNMIRAYARQVGLDERELSEMYLDEVHLFEVGMPRESRRSPSRSYSGYDRGGYEERPPGIRDSYARSSDYSRTSRSSSFERNSYGRDDYGRARSSYSPSRSSSSSRRFSEPLPSSQRGAGYYGSAPRNDRYDDEAIDYASGRSRSISFRSSPRGRTTVSDEPVRYGGRRSQPLPDDILPSWSRSIHLNDRVDESSRGRRDRREPSRSDTYVPSLYSNEGTASRGLSLNMPMIIIAAIVAIAIIIALVVLFNSGKQSVDDIPDIPISGLTDTSDPEGELPVVSAAVAPVSAEVTYAVESGARSYIEVVENGTTTFSGVATGPANETYTVTGTLTFRTANPTPVSLSVDGEVVKLSKSSNSDYYTYTVDFSEILAAWRAENEPQDVGSAADGATGGAGTVGTSNTASNGNTSASSKNTQSTSQSSTSSNKKTTT